MSVTDICLILPPLFKKRIIEIGHVSIPSVMEISFVLRFGREVFVCILSALFEKTLLPQHHPNCLITFDWLGIHCLDVLRIYKPLSIHFV